MSFPGGDFGLDQDPTARGRPEFRTEGAFDLVVEGVRSPGNPLSRMEQRTVNPDMDPTEIGRRGHPRTVTARSVHLVAHGPDGPDLPRDLPLRDGR